MCTEPLREPAPQAGGLDPLRALQQLLLPSVLACLQAVDASLREGDLVLAIVVPPALEGPPLEVHVVAAAAPAAATAPGEAVVLGPPRQVPVAKVGSSLGGGWLPGAS